MQGYFIEEYEDIAVAYWISPKGYYYLQSDKGTIKRISAEEYMSAYDAHYNY